ncbi:MAG: GAF domain-containing protein [Anaerolineales bacterium]|nr:GAF domain-containing protein [Anaerolineales bacterium]
MNFGTGIGVFIAGLVVITLAWFLLRLLIRNQSPSYSEPISQLNPGREIKEAIIVIQPGGRVEYLSPSVRAFFNLREDEPYDLERLARFVRPSDDFIDLCVTPGIKRVSIGGKPAELASYEVPGNYPRILVSIRGRETSVSSDVGNESESANEILQVVTDFSQSIAASFDLENTVRTILDHVSRLVPADVIELKLWNEERKALMPFRYQNIGAGKIITATLSRFGELTDQLSMRRIPLMYNSVGEMDEFNSQAELNPIQSYLGIPLLAGGELVGTLEVGQLNSGAFGSHDLNILHLVSGQVAIAIRNARLYEDEQKRRAELTGLAGLNRVFGSVRDGQDVISQLVESIAPLFDAEIIGFLIFDETKHSLEGRVPFRGLPDHFVEIYRVNIPADSPADKIITGHEPILTSNAMADEIWRTLGLADVATAASLRDIALMPLLSSGHMHGYLQVGHHARGVTSFNNEEIRLMGIVANQAASIIENVLLMQQARVRAQRADSLKRIASLAASSATLDEILKFSMLELARLFNIDSGAFFLVDEARGRLVLNRESMYGVSSDLDETFIQIFVDDPQYRHTVSGSKRAFISGHLSSDRRIRPLYRPLAGALAMESAMVIPLVARDRSLGELMLGSIKPDFFNSSDLQTVSTAAGQIAAAVETAGLLSQTDDTLRKRVDQLSAITKVNRELISSLDTNHLLSVLHDEAIRITKADCASVVLFSHSSSPADPIIELSTGCHRASTVTNVERNVLRNSEPMLIADFVQDAMLPPHEDVRSAVILPITHHARPLGLLAVHAARPGFFTPETVELLQLLTSQSGVALSSAHRYQTEKQHSELMRRRADTLVRLTDISQNLGIDQPLDQALQMIARGIRDATPFRVVLISLLEADSGQLRRVTSVGLSQETWNELSARKQPLSSVQQLMRPEFKSGNSYFIPANQTPIIPPDVHRVTLDTGTIVEQGVETWKPEDFLIIPLESSEGDLIGLISLDDPSDGLRPDKATIESLEVFASQAALLIGNTLRQIELRSRIDQLSSAFDRQQKLIDMAKDDLPVLLRKDLEQTISLHNLDRRAQRVRAGLAITESVSRQLDAGSALSALGRETLTQLGMAVALIAENTADGPRLLHVLGSLPRSTNVEALFGQRNPLRACLQSGKPILIPNLDEDDEWRDAALLTSLRAKGVICLPVAVEGKPISAMLAASPEPMPAFTDEDRHVYTQISQQTSVILQNISLLNTTRRRLDEVNLLLDFSRQLSGMDANSIVGALLTSARRVIPHAHAGVVLVWNQKIEQLVPLAVSGYADNDSMMKINYRIGEALPGMAFMNRKARRVDEINFPRDYNLNTENLAHYRQATGGRLPVSCLLVPIVATEQNLGLLILDNFNTTNAFRTEDETLLVSLSQQVALSLDNMRLVETSQERAGQLQALNEASASLTSSLSTEQLIHSLIDQLSYIIPFDTATLWLREKDRLAVVSTRGFSDIEERQGLSVSVSDSALFKELAQTGQPIFVKDVREDHRFPPVDAPRLSWLGVPLIYKGELVGVLAVEKWQSNYYTREQIQSGFTFASQAAVSLENSRLFEDSVKRATELDRRSQRLNALNRFTSTLTRSLDADQIMSATADELFQSLNASRVSLVTFDRGQNLWNYTTPRFRLKLPRLLPDAPIFSRLRDSRGIFNTDDVRGEPDLVSILEMLGEDTRALLILPLLSNGMVSALAFVQLMGENRFGINELEVARTIVNQSSIALENARLYQTSVRMADRFAVLNETSSLVGASLNADEIYSAVHQAAERLLPLDSMVISLLDVDADEVDPVYIYDRGKRFSSERIPFGSGLSSEVIRSGKPFLIDDAAKEKEINYVEAGDDSDGTRSILAVPMILGGRALGMLSVQSYQVGIYTAEDTQLLGTLANQAIVAIQNGRLFNETQTLAAELEMRVLERTGQLQREKQNTDTLLRILTEVSSSLDLDRALNRTLSLLNEASGAEQGTILLVHAEDNLLHYRAGYGYLTDRSGSGSSGKGFTLKIGEGLAGWVVKHRQTVLIEDLFEDERWVRSAATGQDHRSAIAVPMSVGEDAIGVLMVFHREPRFFNPELLNLVAAIAGQVAVAINNARLYELIRDQAERLGLMLRKEQVEASRSQAILEAVADGVLVTDADNRISFVNSSITRVLGVDDTQMLGKSLEGFAGLFGSSSIEWIKTIRQWSEDPSTFQVGDMFSEQIELENGRIVLVHLAPVIMISDFLGTVSIFRDITREVEVDRLKSEFVATVSHELRTPMTAIKGYVDILTMGAAGTLNENQMHFLDVVRNNIERLNILVSDLLDISRIESGRVDLERNPVDVHGIAEEVVTEVLRRSQDEQKAVALSLDAPQTLPKVNGDGARIRQIISNLVNNAFNYTPENGTILVNIHAEEDEIQVDVQDSGIGIRPEDQGRIFERFYRGEHPLVLATPGTGLGLPIVRQLVEMHNGRMWMKSTGIPGEGSTFSFTLPVYKNGANI